MALIAQAQIAPIVHTGYTSATHFQQVENKA